MSNWIWTEKRLLVIGNRSLYEEVRSVLPSDLFPVEYVDFRDLERPVAPRGDEHGLILVEVAGTADLSLIDRIRRHTAWPIVAVAQQPTPALIVRALQSGAIDFLSRPVDPGMLVSARAGAAEKAPPSAEHGQEAGPDESRYGMIFAASAAMAEIRDLIDRVAHTDIPVLITGEAGTGKEKVARAIHALSHRRAHPLVKLDAVAIRAGLLDRELFGRWSGRVSGPDEDPPSPGRLKLARPGMLLLDEIGETDPTVQTKLLRVLEEGLLAGSGTAAATAGPARVVATTRRDLEQEVARGRFRQDLYYRLNIITIAVPPLRERPEDVPEFSAHFLKKYTAPHDKKGIRLSPATEKFMRSYHWPGNVRELESLIRRIAAGESQRAALAALQEQNGRDGGADPDAAGRPEFGFRLREASRRAAREAERRLIRGVLEENRWNRRRAAEILQISYRTLLYKIKQSGLDLPR